MSTVITLKTMRLHSSFTLQTLPVGISRQLFFHYFPLYDSQTENSLLCKNINKTFIAYSMHILSCQARVTVTSCFVYKVIRNLESIFHLCINPICRIGLILKWYIDSRQLMWSVKVNVLLNNCKQNITSLSLLVGTTVHVVCSYTCTLYELFTCKCKRKRLFKGIDNSISANLKTRM